MAKKKGKNRKYTANKKSRVNPSKPNPSPSKVGATIGEALAKAIGAKVEQAKANSAASQAVEPGLARRSEISNPLLRPEVREPTSPLKQLNVRTPDAQRITWGTEKRNPQYAGPYEDPLITDISYAKVALWTWVVSKAVWVKAKYNFDTGAYSVEMEFAKAIDFVRGTAREAKQVAEALLSASDWETSWQNVLGNDYSANAWKDYDNGPSN